MKIWTSFLGLCIWNGKRARGDETHPCQSTKPVSYDFLQILRQNILTMNNNVSRAVKFPPEGFKLNSNSSIN